MEKTLTAQASGPITVKIKSRGALMVTVVADPRVKTATALVTAARDIDVKSSDVSDGWYLEFPDEPGQTVHMGGGRIIGSGVTIVTGGGDMYVTGGQGVHVVEGEPMPAITLRVPPASSVIADVVAGRVGVEQGYPLALLAGTTQSADFVSLADLGALRVKTMSGDVEVEGGCGSAQAETMSGDIELADALGPVQAKTMSGDIEVTSKVIVQMMLSSMSGDVNARVPVGGRDNVMASSMSGDVRIRH